MVVVMHILLLLGIVPFVLLFAAISFFVLMLVASAVVEFPLIVLPLILGVGLWKARKMLPNSSKKQNTLCEQM
ncbi:cysteine/glutathione ABC transporter membrane/ATP-binding protein [Methylocaldum marinum]|uniref:Cysteine/glutathione ABC transporter membrane/ATP-binding protein n=2 Tax=Methylocaldum marinum TaxID=1432792 RepID=A0A250L0P2_9GAMM|nr:cysteine/glutathione ABC transporter membrane/ATP-binding protein [Methylocaldum marinum]